MSRTALVKAEIHGISIDTCMYHAGTMEIVNSIQEIRRNPFGNPSIESMILLTGHIIQQTHPKRLI